MVTEWSSSMQETVLRKELAEDQEILVDKHGVLAFEKSVQLEIRRTRNCLVCCCARQGPYNAALKGPGFIILHTMSLGKLRNAISGSGANLQSNTGGGA